jgi:predicted nucleic acid-binding protein
MPRKDKRWTRPGRFLIDLMFFHWTGESTLRSAKIVGELKRKGSPIDVLDALVAGISLAHGRDVVVTRNKRHFENVKGLKVETY